MPMEIFCPVGKVMADLPKEASNQDSDFPGAEIAVCKGCQHPGHLKQMDYIQNNIEAAEAIGNKLEAVLAHKVSVIKSSVPQYDGKIICTCNCTLRTVTK